MVHGAASVTPATSVATPTQPTPPTGTQIPSAATPSQLQTSSIPTGQIPSATRSHPAPLTSETSGIFSPLDSGASLTRLPSAVSRQPVASPLLIAHTQRKVPSVEVMEAQHRTKPNGVGGRVESLPGGTQDECDGRR